MIGELTVITPLAFSILLLMKEDGLQPGRHQVIIYPSYKAPAFYANQQWCRQVI